MLVLCCVVVAVVVSGSVMVFVLSDVNIRSRAIGNIAADCRHPASPNTAHGPHRPDHSLMSGDVRGLGGWGARRPGMWSVAIITAALSGLILVNMSGSQSEGGDTLYHCTRGTVHCVRDWASVTCHNNCPES